MRDRSEAKPSQAPSCSFKYATRTKETLFFSKKTETTPLSAQEQKDLGWLEQAARQCGIHLEDSFHFQSVGPGFVEEDKYIATRKLPQPSSR
jgi:hypothetical protein